MKHVFTVTCEWDIGLSDVAFETSEKAEAAARAALSACGIDELYEELVGAGLVHVNPVPVR